MSTAPTPPPVATDPPLRRVLLCFGLILAVLVLVVAVSLNNLSRTVATSDWVNHTHALITELDTLQPTLTAAEGELSRYLLTADQRDHTDYQNKFAELGEHTDVAIALCAGTPAEQQQFQQIALLLAKRAEVASQIVQLKKAGEAAALQRLLGQDAESHDHRELAQLIEKFRATQTDLLSARDRTLYLQAQTTRWTVLTGLALDFLLLCGAAWLIRDALAARTLANRLLQQSNAVLEEKVTQRTAELSATNAQLAAQSLEDRWSKQALEHQNRYNLLIIDSISDAVFVVTKLMNISRLNPAAVHLAGFEPVELIDKPLARLLSTDGAKDPAKPTFDPLARTLSEGHELRDRAGFLATKGGQSLPVRLSIFPLRDRDKVVGGVVILKLSAPATP